MNLSSLASLLAQTRLVLRAGGAQPQRVHFVLDEYIRRLTAKDAFTPNLLAEIMGSGAGTIGDMVAVGEGRALVLPWTEAVNACFPLAAPFDVSERELRAAFAVAKTREAA